MRIKDVRNHGGRINDVPMNGVRFGVVTLVAVLSLGACTSDPAESVSPDAVPPGADTVYSTSTTVIETPEHGPEMVFAVLDSYPPQGEGLALSNWSWSDAPSSDSFDGTTWGGDYRLVGTWDGNEFTLTEPATPSTEGLFAERVYDTPTPDCDEDDFGPTLEFLDTLDREALGIVGSGGDVWDGRCGAYVEAYFDTPDLSAALEPMADRIATFFYLTPLD